MNYPNITRELIESCEPCQEGWYDVYQHTYPNPNFTWPELFNLPDISDKDKVWIFTREIPELESQKLKCLVKICDDFFNKNDDKICKENKMFYYKVKTNTFTDLDIKNIEDLITHSGNPCDEYNINYVAYRHTMALKSGGYNGLKSIASENNYKKIIDVAKSLNWE
jgi:hypothetical protein